MKCWGNNREGQLGDGTTTNSFSPVDVSGLTAGVLQIPASERNTCALMNTGGVKCWGANGFGELGNGTTTSGGCYCVPTPVDVAGLSSGVAQISSYGSDTCVVTTSGGAKCWGANESGELGNGTTTGSSLPVDVSGLTSGVAQISGAGCAVTSSGGAKCWGSNFDGQLGDGTTTDSTTPVDVSGLTADVAEISAGGDHTCAVMTIGAVKCWGANEFGELGDGALTQAGSLTPVYVAGLSAGLFRADALIKRSVDSTYVGDGVYNSTTQSQGVTTKVSAGNSATFKVKVQNDGLESDPIELAGCSGATGFEVTYMSAGVDVTANMVAGGQSTGALAPGDSYTFSVKIHAMSTALSGSRDVCKVEATSVDDVTKKDAVRATLGVS